MTEKKSFLETIAEGDKPESFGQEKFIRVNNGKQMKKIISISIIIALLFIGSYVVYSIMNKVTVPKLVGMTLADAIDWAQKNRVTLSAKSVYNFENDEDMVLSQGVGEGTSIKKNSTVSVQVSLGADPEEKITFPDIESMTTSEIEIWVSENKLTGVKLVTANSDIVEANHVISYTFTDGSEDNFKRKNRVTITVSIGSEELSETVVASDFSSMKAGSILKWGSDNGVIINLIEAFDDYITAGNVISQSMKANTEMKRTTGITVVISKGKSVAVPNFERMSKDEANTWAKLNNVVLTILEKYSDSDDKGTLYNQSIASGYCMKEGNEIKLICSLGRIDVASYIGKTKLDILNWQKGVNVNGAGIILTFTEAYGDKGTAGKIISQSIKNDVVPTGTTINVVISKGMKIATPDFAGKTEAECSTIGKDNGLTILFDYQNSGSVSKGYVISQSYPKDTIISDADTLTVVISLGTD